MTVLGLKSSSILSLGLWLVNTIQPQWLPFRSQIRVDGGSHLRSIVCTLELMKLESGVQGILGQDPVMLLRQLPKCGCLRPCRTVGAKSICRQPSGSELNAVGGAWSQCLMGRCVWFISVHGVPAAWFLPTRLPSSPSAQKLR